MSPGFGRVMSRSATLPRAFKFHGFQRQQCGVEEPATAGVSFNSDPDVPFASVMDEVVTEVMVRLLANFIEARLELPEKAAGLIAQEAMTNVLMDSLTWLAQNKRAGPRQGGAARRSSRRYRAWKDRGWSVQYVQARLAEAEMSDISEEEGMRGPLRQEKSEAEEAARDPEPARFEEIFSPNVWRTLETPEQNPGQVPKLEPSPFATDQKWLRNLSGLLNATAAVANAQGAEKSDQEPLSFKQIDKDSLGFEFCQDGDDHGGLFQRIPELNSPDSFAVNQLIAIEPFDLSEFDDKISRRRSPLGPLPTIKQSAMDDSRHDWDGRKVPGLGREVQQTNRRDIVIGSHNDTPQRSRLRSSPSTKNVGRCIRKRDLALSQADELDFDAHARIEKKFREEMEVEANVMLQETAQVLNEPAPMLASLEPKNESCEGVFADSRGPRGNDITLLISTLEFEQCCQHTDLIRRGCPQTFSGRWAWIYAPQLGARTGYSLITRTSSLAARHVLGNFHQVSFEGCATMETDVLRVMYVEPRDGCELLVEGLTMPDGEFAMTRRLFHHFEDYEM